MAHHNSNKGSGLPSKESKPKQSHHGKDINSKKVLDHDSKDARLWECRQCSPGGSSVFHVPLPSPSRSEYKDGLAGITKFAEQLQEACRAGTRTSDRLSSLLAGTAMADVAGRFLQLQHSLETGIGDVVTWLSAEVDNYIKKLNCESTDQTKGQGHNPDDLQILSVGFNLMVHLQYQFFLRAADQLNTFAQSYPVIGNNSKVLRPNGSIPAGRESSPEGCPEPGSGRFHEQLASLFCGHKSVAGQDKGVSKSSWYVNLDEEATRSCHLVATEGNKQVAPSAGQMVANHRQSIPGLSDTGAYRDEVGEPGSRPSGVTGGGSQTCPVSGGLAGEPVSQEELDVVIDMLSRATKYTPVEPSGSDQRDTLLMSKAPGSQLVTASNHGSTLPVFSSVSVGSNSREQSANYGSRATQHRQSDGFICHTTPSREAKTNTWPFKPRHKDMGQAWLDMEYPQAGPVLFPNGDPLTQQGSVFGAGPPPGSSTRQNALIPGLNPGLWSTGPDQVTSMSKGWPVFPNIGEGDAIPRQWSHLADSSSCSDESSSNGELQWMMGSNLMEAVNMKRRHSSGGEDSVVTSGVSLCHNINKSIDSLMEPKSTNTWPPKHPWVSKASADPTSSENPGVVSQPGRSKTTHKPLMPQWSDPLAARPLTIWDAGLSSTMAQQSFNTGVNPAQYSPTSAKQF